MDTTTSTTQKLNDVCNEIHANHNATRNTELHEKFWNAATDWWSENVTHEVETESATVLTHKI